MKLDFTQPLELQKRQYKDLAQQMKPKPPVVRNALWAFFVGGIIVSIGQAFLLLFQALGLTRTDAGAATSILLILIAAVLTGLGVYDELTKYAGAGAIVPITGFANAMIAPALESRTEGLVLGVGARLFSIAGPVIVFATVSAWLIGLIRFLLL